MAIKYRISPAGFRWLSQAFDKVSPISPLAQVQSGLVDADETDIGELVAEKVIASDGTITPEACALFSVLAQAQAFSRIRILGAMSSVDKVTYFHNSLNCSVDSGASVFEVHMPACTSEAAYVLEEFTGTSRLVNVEFDATLSIEGARAFLALVDLVRARSLKALSGEASDFGCAAEEILTRAVGAKQGYMALSRSFADLVEPELLDKQLLISALDELVEKGLVRQQGDLFLLWGDAMELATNFLIPEYVFNISYGRVASPLEVVHSECNVIFCGMHNLLYMEVVGESFNMETMSGSNLFKMLLSAMTEAPPA